MLKIRKTYKLEIAHVLADSYTEACHVSIHGHSYVVEVFLKSDKPGRYGMVKDFGALGSVKEYLMQFDHALIVPNSMCMEPPVRDIYRQYLAVLAKWNANLHIWGENPTAEAMAEFWLLKLQTIDPLVCGVRVHETTTGYAECGDC